MNWHAVLRHGCSDQQRPAEVNVHTDLVTESRMHGWGLLRDCLGQLAYMAVRVVQTGGVRPSQRQSCQCDHGPTMTRAVLQGLRLSEALGSSAHCSSHGGGGAPAQRRQTSDQGVTCDLMSCVPDVLPRAEAAGAGVRPRTSSMQPPDEAAAVHEGGTPLERGCSVAVEVKPALRECGSSPVPDAEESDTAAAQVCCHAALRAVATCGRCSVAPRRVLVSAGFGVVVSGARASRCVPAPG